MSKGFVIYCVLDLCPNIVIDRVVNCDAGVELAGRHLHGVGWAIRLASTQYFRQARLLVVREKHVTEMSGDQHRKAKEQDLFYLHGVGHLPGAVGVVLEFCRGPDVLVAGFVGHDLELLNFLAELAPILHLVSIPKQEHGVQHCQDRAVGDIGGEVEQADQSAVAVYHVEESAPAEDLKRDL